MYDVENVLVLLRALHVFHFTRRMTWTASRSRRRVASRLSAPLASMRNRGQSSAGVWSRIAAPGITLRHYPSAASPVARNVKRHCRRQPAAKEDRHMHKSWISIMSGVALAAIAYTGSHTAGPHRAARGMQLVASDSMGNTGATGGTSGTRSGTGTDG